MKEWLLFRKKERDGIRFHSKRRSRKGTLGFALAVLCAIILCVLCGSSAATAGSAGAVVGIIGLLLAAASAAAFWLSFQGLKEQDVYTGLPLVGLLLAGLVFIILFCLYITGIRL